MSIRRRISTGLARRLLKLDRSEADGPMNDGGWRDLGRKSTPIEIDTAPRVSTVENLRVVKLFRLALTAVRVTDKQRP